MTGEESVFSELSGLLSTWYEVMVPLVLYRYPESKIYDLSDKIEVSY